jgi:hypothetical protein
MLARISLDRCACNGLGRGATARGRLSSGDPSVHAPARAHFDGRMPMEQGPDELSDAPDERAQQLEDLTDEPLDERDGHAATDEAHDRKLDKIDPGL